MCIYTCFNVAHDGEFYRSWTVHVSSLKPAGSLAAIIGGGLRSVFSHVAVKFLHIDRRGKERAISLSGFTEPANWALITFSLWPTFAA